MRDLRQQRQNRPGLIESIKSGLAVPILSDEAIFDLVLPGHRSLVHEYMTYQSEATHTEYKLPDTDNLLRIAKFYKLQRQRQAIEIGKDFTHNDLRADYFDFVKNFLFAYAEDQKVDADRLGSTTVAAGADRRESALAKHPGVGGVVGND